MAALRDAVDVLRALQIWPGRSDENALRTLKSDPTTWAESLAGFEMDEDQARFFREMTADDARRLAQLRDDLTAEQPSQRVVVVLVPDARRPEGFRHEIRTEALADPPAADPNVVKPMIGIVIAHCDAHCRNWGWGPG